MGFTPTHTPIHDHDAELDKAEAGAAKLAATRDDRWYPKFHIASNGGWINDPNGLCRYHGRWHVFYQLHPYGTQWGPMHWGHVSSADMVTWRREPIAMAPSLAQERDGVFSGSAAIGDDGKLRFYYTGHQVLDADAGAGYAREVQMLATAQNNDATRLVKQGMIIDCPRDEVDSDFRDPKVWKTGDTWYMTFGVSSARRRGQMWLYTSHDMVEWTFDRILFEHPDPDVFMLECPDFFPIIGPDGNEKWVIGFSAMGSKPCGFMNRNTSNAGYMIGSWRPGEAFQPESEFRLWDCGHNFYAPQSFTAPDGRQIMIGWMSPFAEAAPMQDDGWCGQLTLPREITLGADGDLHTSPVAELSKLRDGTTDLGALDLRSEENRVIMDDAEAVEIELTLDLSRSTAERMGLKIHATDDGSYSYVNYDDQLGRIVIDRQTAAHGGRGYRTAPLSNAELASGRVDLRIFVDRGSIEVYVNGGRQVLTSYSYPSERRRAIKLTSESGTTHIDMLRIHPLRSIGLE
ncbi:glycoside hydrolase family 32 protein [Bifidobacterium sp.]|jgi:beta-fructofuranosidase|uniref:glycoside hydrolase family 32 protein n=1 Tax=Bifidobacterium sp. TaxID=41200 RepID=UPI0025C07C86|nr:GH32 C-terminal domain-containing protein [Bifidobacterium sp.]MCI1225279.1 GH32 C-terminal domain-containing protein [Bifidobacterium sp.]